MITDINSEDQLVQATFATHLERELGWECVYAWNNETFGPYGTLGRKDTREVVLTRDLRNAIERLNPDLPSVAVEEAITKLNLHDQTRSLLANNQTFHKFIREGVPVSFRDTAGQLRHTHVRVIDFGNGRSADGTPNNRFLAVRELKITGLRAPSYNRRADMICFVNGLPLVFIELKAVYKNIRAAFDGNLRDYLDENVIAHAFHHNAFLIVSNGHRARYGSVTSSWEHFYEWKRLEERDQGSVDAEVLLNGMLAHHRLLDLVENFILFDTSKPGATRKVIARNHQVLGVNAAVESVRRQEELKRQFPTDQRLVTRKVTIEPRISVNERLPENYSATDLQAAEDREQKKSLQTLELVEQAHPQLGKLGVFWHTQGSGKSYSMAFFVEKVRRKVSSKFTFLMMTDRNDLDTQIYRTFVGCGIADKDTPRATSGQDLRKHLKENHRFIFSLIHKFNQDVDPKDPYTSRDDIIVISDEAHRTQAGKLARNMRIALPFAAFIGFTGTPLFKNDHITRRIFGAYVSRYDFKRSEEDGATVRLVYDNRGEKLQLANLDLNDRIATAIAAANLDPDQEAYLEKLLGKDYEVITADDRLDKVANDFVENCSKRWESGKSMLVCIDKITCARMHQRIIPLWNAKIARLKDAIQQLHQEIESNDDAEERISQKKELRRIEGQCSWMEKTIIGIIISEGQNEVADFKKWDFDIIPHRVLMKQGFEGAERRDDVESAFKNPDHPFRVAIVCAMWLTGFDVESLSTLYIDKPMKSHTLIQAIARANRVYPGKDFGLIVDYNGMLKSLRHALAQYALGDENDETVDDDVAGELESQVQGLIEAIEETENHLRNLGFDANRMIATKGFAKIQAIADGADAVYTSDESKRRFEILARVVFSRFKSLVTKPMALVYAERHDNIESIYKKLEERRDRADITDLLKSLHRIVNDAIRSTEPGKDQEESKTYDLSQINLEKLRDEFAKRCKRKATVIQDIRQIIEDKLGVMLALNPQRMDYYKKYSEIVADYNREKDRVTIEETFEKLIELVESLDKEQLRAAEEGLTEQELALFDLLQRESLSKVDRERVKQASRSLLESIQGILGPLERWTEKEQTQAEVETFILDHLYNNLPSPAFTEEDLQNVARRIYEHIWQQSIASSRVAA